MTSIPQETATTSLTDPNHYRSFDNINMPTVETKGPMPTRPWTDNEAEQQSPAGDTTRRKRLSFFGRSSSDASTRKQPLQPLQATMSTYKDELSGSESLKSQPRRPLTAGSEHGRRKTSDQIESIRHSIFGGRKSAMRPTAKRSRHSHQISSIQAQPNVGLIPFTSPLQEEITQPEVRGNVGAKDFRDESDFYHHRKKTSISSPFNFHHVGHTGRQNLPTRLETVDERALSNKLLDFDAHGHVLQGIPADQIRHSRLGLDATLPPKAQLIPSRHRGNPSVDETTFDEASETKFNVDEHFNERPALRSPERAPRRSTSSPALNSPSASSASHTIPHLHTKASFDSSHQSPSREQSPQSDRRPTIPVRGRPLGQSFRENQPLPPVPAPQEPSASVVGKKLSKASLASRRQSIGQLFPAAPGTKAVAYPASIASQMSKRSSKSAAPTVHSTSTKAFSDIPVGLDWEDDIDFAFEQEAEATCDFDWEKYAPYMPPTKEELPAPSPDDSGPESNGSGGVRLSDWINEPSALAGVETIHRSTTSTPSISPLLNEDGQPLNHKRGSSVGHRGFLAARNASTDKLTKTRPLSVEIKNAEVSTPPTISLTTESAELGADQAPKSPYATQTYFPAFDSSIPEYLSDPESTRTGGLRHRKSSSYGSFDSSGRSLATTSASASASESSTSMRWSSASTSSIPDSLHCSTHNSRKRASLRKSITPGSFRMLESVPHSPDGRDEQKSFGGLEDGPGVSDRSMSETILMRRPATSGDRALLFNSGRVVQRGRSGTPTNSRMAIQSLPSAELEGGWI